MTACGERGQRGFGGYAQIFEDDDNDGCLTYPLSHQKLIRYYPPNLRYLRSFKKHPKVIVFLDSMSLQPQFHLKPQYPRCLLCGTCTQDIIGQICLCFHTMPVEKARETERVLGLSGHEWLYLRNRLH